MPKTIRALFWVNTAIWLALAVSTLVRTGGTSAGNNGFNVVISIMMVGNAIGMFLCSFVLMSQKRIFFYLVLLFLGVNILLTFTDQVGLLDYITLVIDLVIVGLLVVDRRKTQQP